MFPGKRGGDRSGYEWKRNKRKILGAPTPLGTSAFRSRVEVVAGRSFGIATLGSRE